jgi:hypothetical protein
MWLHAKLAQMPRSPLVGRQVEVAAISEAVADVIAGVGALVLVAGEPGIGKSRLAEETARLAGHSNLRVAWGRAWEAGGAPPFWPWIQVIRALAPEASAVIDRLLGAANNPASTAEDRFLLFDAATRALATASRDAPAVVLLDDLHAFDVASLHLLAFVAQHAMPVLIVGTYRTAEARLAPSAGSVLERLSRTARTITPRRLDHAAIRELAVPIGLDAAAIETVARQSEGNPLFVIELLSVSHASEVPASVRTAIREHLRALPAALLPVLEVAAAIGRELAGAQVAELCARPVGEVLDELAVAVELGLLVARGGDRFAFAHGLIAETLHHDLPAARRAELHLAIANSLERAHAGDPAAPLSEIAHHLFDAGIDHASRAAQAALRAAEQARRQLAFEPAAALVERALAVIPAANVVGRFELCRLLAEIQLIAGDPARGRDTARQAAAFARSIGSPELIARAALTYGGSWSIGDTDHVLVQLVEEALSALPPGDSSLRAHLLARLASALQPARDPGPPMALAREAIAMIERSSDDRTRLQVLFAASGALVLFAPPDERRAINLATVALAQRLDEPLVELRAHHRLVFDHAELGDLAGVALHHHRYDELVTRLHLPSRARWPSAMMRAMVALAEGRMADHDEAVAEAERLATDAGDMFFRDVVATGHRVCVLNQISDPRTLAGQRKLYATMAAWGRGWVYVEVLAGFDARLGDLDSARGLLSRQHVEMIRDHRIIERCGDVAHTIWLLGDAELAALLYDWLASQGARLGVLHNHAYVICRPAAHSAMLVAATLGDLAAVRRHHAIAARVLRSINARPLEAWLCLDYATILIRTRDRTFRDEAARLLGEAKALAIACRIDLGRQLAELAAELATRSQQVTSVADVTVRRDGETWLVEGFGASCRLKASRGVEVLARLVAEPNRELHALDLLGDAGEPIDGGDAGEVLDGQAKAAYKTRLRELRDDLDEAVQWNDSARAERARDEIDALETELSRAIGHGGRSRRVGRAAERARINVQRRLADTMRRIAETAPELGRHLAAAIRTGVYCSYVPDRAHR